MGLSREWAELLSDVANWAFLGSLVVGVIAAALIWWTAKAKEEYSARDLGAASERISANEVEAARANARAAEASLALEKLKHPRTITIDQQIKLIACLSSAPRGPVYLRPALWDADAPNFAKQIEEVLKASGVDVEKWPGDDSVIWHQSGIFLIVRDRTKPPAHALAIQSCFESVGLELPGGEDKNHPIDGVSIAIGPKL